jgi:hypothetical protein
MSMVENLIAVGSASGLRDNPQRRRHPDRRIGDELGDVRRRDAILFAGLRSRSASSARRTARIPDAFSPRRADFNWECNVRELRVHDPATAEQHGLAIKVSL